jgi:predicted RNase H-like HicB family nuclease
VKTVKYLVIIERGDSSYGAQVPDLPGCYAVGETEEETLRLIREAIELHLEGLAAAGQPVPRPCSKALTVEVPSATAAL